MCPGDMAQSHTVLSTQWLGLTCSGEGSYEECAYRWQEVKATPELGVKTPEEQLHSLTQR